MNFTITEKASAVINQVLEHEFESEGIARVLRISIQGGGCSGFSYNFALEEFIAEDDNEIRADGAIVVIDPLSAQYLEGATLDYTESVGSKQFVLHNPNATTKCGCGQSFSA